MILIHVMYLNGAWSTCVLNQGLHKRRRGAVGVVMMFVGSGGASVGGSDGGNCDCDND